MKDLTDKKRLFVILGMHRSGTSIFTKCLETLGVNLELPLVTADDNPTGFWEDPQIKQINEDLLKLINADWDSVRVLGPEIFCSSIVSELIETASIYLSEKLDRNICWGFKDPRTSRLIPFWQKVFKRIDVEPAYILVLRHPTSVVSSLSVRNGFTNDKGYLLWLRYVGDVIRHLSHTEFHIALYDNLLDKTLAELERLSKFLGREIIPELYEVFSKSILDKQLQHTCYSLDEELLSDSLPERIAVKCYQELVDISESQTNNDKSNLRLNELLAELDPIDGLCVYQDALSSLLKQTLPPSNVISSPSYEQLKSECEQLKSECEQLKSKCEQLKLEQEQIQSLNDELQSEIGHCQEASEKLHSENRTLYGWLEIERFSVVKPIMRRFYKAGAKAITYLPKPLSKVVRNIRRRLLPSGISYGFSNHNVPARYGNFGEHLDSEQYGLLGETLNNSKAPHYDVMLFPVIDWDFRIQRPQHLVRELAVLGHRIIYFATTFYHSKNPDFKILDNPSLGVFIVQLGLPNPPSSIYHSAPCEKQVDQLVQAVNKLGAFANVKEVVALVNLPFWRRVAERLRGALLVYDCMDHHAGFENNSAAMLDEEAMLIERADVLIASSGKLYEELRKKRADVELIRNGAEVSYFNSEPSKLAWNKTKPVVGYYGAIAEWFDIDLLTFAAASYPDWDFMLVGAVTECNISKAKKLKNIHFVGEVPYGELSRYLYAFDVCVIPFKINELTMCTNPVKVYEYMAAGRPIVSTALPEVELLSEYVHISYSAESFVDKLRSSMDEAADQSRASELSSAAIEHDWAERAKVLDSSIAEHFPLVSVVVLTYNNLEYTKACLDGLYRYTRYPNWEVIVVDNASSDDTQNYLAEFAIHHTNMHLIFNEDNLGFSAGNNIGLREAKGEYLVILNNDTYVMDGWMLGLIRHLRFDEGLGIIGPVTNNIGNEAKIDIDYSDMEQMQDRSGEYVGENSRNLMYVNTVAFFCVAMTREVYEKVGDLDEQFGLGFFEDDDYCNRIKEHGYKVAIADDVFVHHHLSASFDQLKADKKKELFEQNKKIYESKWGEWNPHVYRQ